jgi:uncharacterized protein (TIGR00369 family)
MAQNSSSPSDEQLARYAENFNRSLTLRHFGVTISFPSRDRLLVKLDKILPHHLGGLGTNAVNGGVLAALFDLAIGCTPALIDPTRRTATLQLSMSFERPVFGDSLSVEAQLDNAGSTVLFASARVLDQSGSICARCQGVVRLSRHSWQDGGSPATN